MLNTWRLKLLVHLFNLKTIKAVAQASTISSAAVSSQLKLLEQETNMILIERHGRNLKLTANGIQLVHKVQPILDQLEKINNNLKYPDKIMQGQVRISGFSSALKKIIIPVMCSIRNKYPKIEINFTEQNADKSLIELASNQVELAIFDKFGNAPFINHNLNYEWFLLGVDSLKVLINKKNPLSRLKSVNLSQIQNNGSLLVSSEKKLSEYVYKSSVNQIAYQGMIHTISDYTLMKEMVLSNLAIGILPEISVDLISENEKILDLVPETKHYIYLAARKPSFSIPSIKLVADIIKSQSNEIFNYDQYVQLK